MRFVNQSSILSFERAINFDNVKVRDSFEQITKAFEIIYQNYRTNFYGPLISELAT